MNFLAVMCSLAVLNSIVAMVMVSLLMAAEGIKDGRCEVVEMRLKRFRVERKDFLRGLLSL